MKSDAPTKPKAGDVMPRLFTFLMLAAAVYILSVGPVLTIAARFDAYNTPFYKPLRAFYRPVFAIAKSSDTGTHLYESYVRMWCRILLPPGSPGT